MNKKESKITLSNKQKEVLAKWPQTRTANRKLRNILRSNVQGCPRAVEQYQTILKQAFCNNKDINSNKTKIQQIFAACLVDRHLARRY